MTRPTAGASSFLPVLAAAALLLAGCVPPRMETPPPPPARVPPSPPPAPVPPIPPPTAGSTIPKTPSVGAGNPPFYEVFGERYFVMPSSDGYRERGMASWYGEAFQGRRTSSGAIYDMHELTAAHKTLPLPSLVRVTSLDTGRSVVVTVNDRGPFVKERLIDLSYAAATQLGIVQSGVGRVEVEALGGRSAARPLVVAQAIAPGPADTGIPVAPTLVPVQRLFMQVGAFGEAANADRLKSRLESNGVNDVIIRYDNHSTPPLYRVLIGPIAGSGEYDALASRVASLRIGSPELVTESGRPPTR